MNPHGTHTTRGFSLVELMVAIAIGLLILAALTTIFAGSSKTSSEIERASEQTDNGAYALQVLSDELRNAGYLGEFNGRLLAIPANKPDPCVTDLAGLNSALPVAIQGYDQGAGAPSCLADVKANTDILVIRRTSVCAVGDTGCDPQVSGLPYFQASTCNSTSELGSPSVSNYFALDTDTSHLNLHTKSCLSGELAPLRQYRVKIYFIANNDKSGDGIPTLKVAELAMSGGALGWSIAPIVEGVENMQLEYGLDAPLARTGNPVAFAADPDSYASCTSSSTPTCTAYWANTVALRIHLLVRALTPSPGFTSAKTYAMGLDGAGNALTLGPYTDSFKRHVFESQVRINNVAARNLQ